MRISLLATGPALAALLALSALPAAAEMVLTSPDISEGKTIGEDFIFDGFGCTGPNLSPALSWSGAPEGTNSFILTVYDPDAPTGSGFWHWSLFDLPASTTALPRGIGTAAALPAGAMAARNDYSQNAWGGPCPPQGDKPHRYIFTVYAMPQEKLGIDETASGAVVGFFAHAAALDHASLTAIYGR
ncbi:YbhB/YbcL family Raf kinase inhibitor-like protein [Rhodobacter maris]|uniref:PBP family phospholipid-binding protein n=1 Tax=Rhodobacter maris TaxID=446682 RepID=A0A285S753_9RHOB|nr:YbhB/YbcL family Raf kinase inhibitor-like protein [Rhodobacter maris]SOC03314.1 PBP family phospholipid-binding protein [Rhodobacter maris]